MCNALEQNISKVIKNVNYKRKPWKDIYRKEKTLS